MRKGLSSSCTLLQMAVQRRNLETQSRWRHPPYGKFFENLSACLEVCSLHWQSKTDAFLHLLCAHGFHQSPFSIFVLKQCSTSFLFHCFPCLLCIFHAMHHNCKPLFLRTACSCRLNENCSLETRTFRTAERQSLARESLHSLQSKRGSAEGRRRIFCRIISFCCVWTGLRSRRIDGKRFRSSTRHCIAKGSPTAAAGGGGGGGRSGSRKTSVG